MALQILTLTIDPLKMMFWVFLSGVSVSAGLRVAMMTTSDCRQVATYGPSETKKYIPAYTQFAASLALFFHLKMIFPNWDAVFLSDPSRWGNKPKCHDTVNAFSKAYSEAFGGETLRLVPMKTSQYRVLQRISQTHGKETDHSRGHWPVDAYMHLAAVEPLLALGYDYGVYVDPDVYFLDDSLVHEIPQVRDIGCIAAIPPECLTLNLKGLRNVDLRAMHDEYRLVSNATLRSTVSRVASKYGSSYSLKNSTNSGIVIYNTRNLVAKRWVEWLADLFEVSTKGFYGDQTALTAAYGLDSVNVHWLSPRFNVGLTFPKDAIRTTCGPDVRYSKYAAKPDNLHNISAVHFIWGPKPWMTKMNVHHAMPTRFAVQADVRYANMYRHCLKMLLPYDLIDYYFSSDAFAVLNHTTPHYHPGSYGFCDRDPYPCWRPYLPASSRRVAEDKPAEISVTGTRKRNGNS